MADFKEVLEVAQRGYHNREDYPPYALASWDDRTRWTKYLEMINEELEQAKEGGLVIDSGLSNSASVEICGKEGLEALRVMVENAWKQGKDLTISFKDTSAEVLFSRDKEGAEVRS